MATKQVGGRPIPPSPFPIHSLKWEFFILAIVGFGEFSPWGEFLVPVLKFKGATKSDPPLSPSLTLRPSQAGSFLRGGFAGRKNYSHPVFNWEQKDSTRPNAVQGPNLIRLQPPSSLSLRAHIWQVSLLHYIRTGDYRLETEQKIPNNPFSENLKRFTIYRLLKRNSAQYEHLGKARNWYRTPCWVKILGLVGKKNKNQKDFKGLKCQLKTCLFHRYRSGVYKEKISILAQHGIDTWPWISVCVSLCLIVSCWQAQPNFALGVIDAMATRE